MAAMSPQFVTPIGWVPTQLDPRKMIAVPTLALVRAYLKDADVPPAPTLGGDATLTARVQDLPALFRIGGVARLDGGTRGPVAVARISRATFVAFEPTAEGAELRELPVEVEPATGALRVLRGAGLTPPRAGGGSATSA
jgi:hypothetical protein